MNENSIQSQNIKFNLQHLQNVEILVLPYIITVSYFTLQMFTYSPQDK